MNLDNKYHHLIDMLKGLESLAVAFSGGVDSTFLLKAAVEALGSDNVLAVTSDSETYPARQLAEAEKLAKEIGVAHVVTYTSELGNKDFAENNQQRCYYCKHELFSEVLKIAAQKGLKYVVDGSNYDDQVNDYRPGLKAAAELKVRSPLKEAEITKKEIRILSKRLGLPTWDKPSFACLSSRFPYGIQIGVENLTMVDRAEEFLQRYNFKQLRVRHHDANTARIEVMPDDMTQFLKEREAIVEYLKEIGYTYITLDIEGYRTGSMNEIIA